MKGCGEAGRGGDREEEGEVGEGGEEEDDEAGGKWRRLENKGAPEKKTRIGCALFDRG